MTGQGNPIHYQGVEISELRESLPKELFDKVERAIEAVGEAEALELCVFDFTKHYLSDHVSDPMYELLSEHGEVYSFQNGMFMRAAFKSGDRVFRLSLKGAETTGDGQKIQAAFGYDIRQQTICGQPAKAHYENGLEYLAHKV